MASRLFAYTFRYRVRRSRRRQSIKVRFPARLGMFGMFFFYFFRFSSSRFLCVALSICVVVVVVGFHSICCRLFLLRRLVRAFVVISDRTKHVRDFFFSFFFVAVVVDFFGPLSNAGMSNGKEKSGFQFFSSLNCNSDKSSSFDYMTYSLFSLLDL